jgi:phosphotransferase system HPr-like phosphotransfer protein
MRNSSISIERKALDKPLENKSLHREGNYLQELIISEKEFLRLVNNAAVDTLRISLFLSDEKNAQKFLNKKLFYVISTSARNLEDFLDDHGARNNRNWHTFRELVATSRSFAFIAFLVEHIEKSHFGTREQKVFREYLDKTKTIKRYLKQVLLLVFRLIREEAERLTISFPPRGLSERYYYDMPSNRILPQNLGEEELKNEKEYIIKISSEALNIVEEFADLRSDRAYSPEELAETIPKIINEEKIRKFELSMHNLESVYDTYVKGTAHEGNDPKLNHLRTHISITLHLLEIARALAHFFERHEKINNILVDAVVGNNVLHCTVNWALYYTHQIMQSTKDLSEELLKAYAATDSIELPVPRDLGFHLRPSTLVAKVVNHYGSEVHLVVGNDRFDAKSVLSLTWAGGKIAREKIQKVIFEGDKRALEDLKILANVNYGEDHMGKDRPLPNELSYLR